MIPVLSDRPSNQVQHDSQTNAETKKLADFAQPLAEFALYPHLTAPWTGFLMSDQAGLAD